MDLDIADPLDAIKVDPPFAALARAIVEGEGTLFIEGMTEIARSAWMKRALSASLAKGDVEATFSVLAFYLRCGGGGKSDSSTFIRGEAANIQLICFAVRCGLDPTPFVSDLERVCRPDIQASDMGDLSEKKAPKKPTYQLGAALTNEKQTEKAFGLSLQFAAKLCEFVRIAIANGTTFDFDLRAFASSIQAIFGERIHADVFFDNIKENHMSGREEEQATRILAMKDEILNLFEIHGFHGLINYITNGTSGKRTKHMSKLHARIFAFDRGPTAFVDFSLFGNVTPHSPDISSVTIKKIDMEMDTETTLNMSGMETFQGYFKSLHRLHESAKELFSLRTEEKEIFAFAKKAFLFKMFSGTFPPKVKQLEKVLASFKDGNTTLVLKSVKGSTKSGKRSYGTIDLVREKSVGDRAKGFPNTEIEKALVDYLSIDGLVDLTSATKGCKHIPNLGQNK